MKIYLAAPWTFREDARVFADQLEQDGHELTEKWWLHHDVGVYPHPAEGAALEELQQQAAADIIGVASCDVVVVLQLEKSEGKAVETGLGLALSKPIIVMSPSNERGNLFHYMPEDFVRVVTSYGAVQDALEKVVISE